MKVFDFINEYNNLRGEEKEKFIYNMVVVDYINYERKIDVCNKIVKHTSYNDVNGIKFYHIDTPVRFMLYNLHLINLYTNIDIDFENGLAEYNALESENLLGKLLHAIPEAEMVRMDDIFKMVESDFYENERSLVAYADNKLGALDYMKEPIKNGFEKIVSSPKFMELIMKK